MPDNRNPWIDHLRSSLSVLVVAHHASLAYTGFAYFDKHAYINSTHPVVDTHRWKGLDVFVNFNDIFFMSLMFLIGGLFLSKSIEKKGVARFMADRIYRLFLPFLLLGTFLMLLAYFPAYHLASNQTGLSGYVTDFFTTEKWPVGPPWFIWVLFFFNIMLLLLQPLIRRGHTRLQKIFAYLSSRPFLVAILLLVFTWILYVPIAYRIGAGTWTGWGPFDFQLSRLLLYFGYFILGVIIGNTDFHTQLFSPRGMLVQRWWLWLLLCLGVFTMLTIGSPHLEVMVKDGRLKEFTAWMIYYTVYSLSCVLSCLAFITLFRKFFSVPSKTWASLSENAYLIYLVHYIFVVWMQFLLLQIGVTAWLKFILTFVVSLLLSWGTAKIIRKNRLAKKYL